MQIVNITELFGARHAANNFLQLFSQGVGAITYTHPTNEKIGAQTN